MTFGREEVFNEHDLFNEQAANEDGPDVAPSSEGLPSTLADGGATAHLGIVKDIKPASPAAGKDAPAKSPGSGGAAPSFKADVQFGLNIDMADNNEVLLSDLVNGHPNVLASHAASTQNSSEEARTTSPVPDGRSSASGHGRRGLGQGLGTRSSATASRSPAAPSSEHSQSESRPRKTGRNRRPKFKLRDCVVYWLETKYEVLSEVMQAIGEDWQEANGPDDDVDLLWSDGAITVDRFIKMNSYQRVNHFVGMTSITKKNNLGRNLLRMKKRFPEEYKFFPDTWILPTDLNEFKLQFNGKKNKTFIAKPSDGYQGKGIFLTRDFETIPVDYNSTLVVQRYIHKPFLLDGHKFDLRLYVLVTGCDPLRIFMHEHGLVRLASEEYMEPKGKNLGRTMMHLTNYAINCENPNFEENTNPQDASDGHKRSFQAVLRVLEDQGLDTAELLAQIEDLVVKTLISVQPSLAHVYHSCQPDDTENAMCFEILGFDVLIDWKAKPYLLEVNHAPSFRAETELDRVVKFQALYDAFELLNISPEARQRYKRAQQQGLEERQRGTAERRTMEERILIEEDLARARTEWEGSVKNGYRRLFPITEESRALDYDKYMEAAVDIWETLTGSTTRRKKVLEKAEERDEKEANRRGSSEAGRRGNNGAGPAARRQSSQARPSKTTGSSKDLSAAKVAGNAAAAVAAASASAASAQSNAEKDSGRSTSSRRSGSADKPLAGSAAEALAASSSEPAPASDAEPAPQPKVHHRHADVKAGDTIQVQTNLGWETVTVQKKHPSGQLDIQFEDGEEMKEVMPRILKQQGKSTKDLPAQASTGRPGSAGRSGYQGAGQRPGMQGQRSPGSPPLLPASVAHMRLGSEWTGFHSSPAASSSSPVPRGSEMDATPPPGAATSPGTAAVRPSSDGTHRPSTNNPSSRTSISPTPGEGRSPESPDPRIRQRMQKALHNNSFEQMKQKLLREHEGHMHMGSRIGVETRVSRDTKSRQRMRPLLPPRAPSWSPGCITAYRPALAIEARSVPLPSTRPRTGHNMSGMVAGEPAASHGPALAIGVAHTAPGSRVGTAVAPGAGMGSERPRASTAGMHLRRQASH
mmetsp:Transcript_4094/g.7351  ORF Transcript_4094/g.7351 Transcript_4094/m.7351 type:complete len:1093 (-) Transcript_4094:100-3378(-)